MVERKGKGSGKVGDDEGGNEQRIGITLQMQGQ